MTDQEWNDGKECDRHEMSWCAFCNPNANSYEKPKSPKKTKSKAAKS